MLGAGLGWAGLATECEAGDRFRGSHLTSPHFINIQYIVWTNQVPRTNTMTWNWNFMCEIIRYSQDNY